MTSVSAEQSFSKSASSYSGEARLQRRLATELLSMLPARGIERILELGAGTGFLTKGLLRRYPRCRVTACDISGRMLDRLRLELSPDGRVRCLRVAMEEFPVDESYPLVVSASALQWTKDLAEVVRRSAAALEPRGVFCVSVMVDGTLTELRTLRSSLFPKNRPARDLPKRDSVFSALETAGLTLDGSQERIEREFAPSAWTMLRRLSRIGVTGGDLGRGTELLAPCEVRKLAHAYDRAYSCDQGVYSTYRVLLVRASKRA